MKRRLCFALALTALICALLVITVSCAETPAAPDGTETVGEVSSNSFGTFSPTPKGDISVDENEISNINSPKPFDPELDKVG